MKPKYFFFDLETTGVLYHKNGIHQISEFIMIGDEIKERFNFKVKPNPKAVVDPDALNVAGVDIDTINAYPDMKTVYLQLINIMDKYVDRYLKTDKFILCGFNNSGFDNPFLKAFFVQNDNPYFMSWFHSGSIDLFVLATYYFANIRHQINGFKLKDVAKMCGIDVDETRLHDAEYDIDLTIDVFNFLKSKMNQIC